jgi:hypothetical protein
VAERIVGQGVDGQKRFDVWGWLRSIRESEDLRTAARCAAFVVGTHADRKGETFVASETVGSEMGGVSKRAAERALAEVERAGFLRRQRREHKPSIWVLTLPEPNDSSVVSVGEPNDSSVALLSEPNDVSGIAKRRSTSSQTTETSLVEKQRPSERPIETLPRVGNRKEALMLEDARGFAEEVCEMFGLDGDQLMEQITQAVLDAYRREWSPTDVWHVLLRRDASGVRDPLGVLRARLAKLNGRALGMRPRGPARAWEFEDEPDFGWPDEAGETPGTVIVGSFGIPSEEAVGAGRVVQREPTPAQAASQERFLPGTRGAVDRFEEAVA